MKGALFFHQEVLASPLTTVETLTNSLKRVPLRGIQQNTFCTIFEYVYDECPNRAFVAKRK